MEIKHWTQQIDLTTQEFIEHFNGLSVEELNWKPGPKSWSIAQHIHHLIVINQTYYPIVKSVRNGTYQLPWIGKWRFMVDLFGRLIHKYVKPESKTKVETFKAALPSTSTIDADIINRFEQHQAELKTFIQSNIDLLDTNTVISSPANKNIVYTLKSAFDIIVSHECRHLDHAKNINALRKQIK
jgi:uncharacterized protein with HEPN domain